MNHKPDSKIRVLVVDDSVLMSRQITGILNDDERIEVVGRAKDGMEALKMVAELEPDVVTLDVEMPRMNGITALKHIMVKHGVPTIMISALTTEGARTTFDALKYGAIDVIAKPSRRENESLDAQKQDIVAKVHRAAAIRTGRSRYIRMPQAAGVPLKTSGEPPDSSTHVIGLGAGTGGYYSLLRIVPGLPAGYQELVLVVLLVARKYLEPFVSYLEAHSSIPVRLVHHDAALEKGTCYVASGADGVEVSMNSQGVPRFEIHRDYTDDGTDGPVDRMLRSLAAFRNRAVGIVLTGSGQDGAFGLAAIRENGGVAVVQEINNCVDPEMPLSALAVGPVDKLLPDYVMAEFLERVRAWKSEN